MAASETSAKESRAARNSRYYQRKKLRSAASPTAQTRGTQTPFRNLDAALAYSRISTDAKPTLETVYAIPKPPPGTLPANAMAMDDASSNVPAFSSWAAGAYPAGLYSTGSFFLGYPYLSELATLPEYRKISECIATEMTRRWIKIQAKDTDEDKTEKVEAIEKALDEFRIRDRFRDATEQDGFFGRGHIYVDLGSDQPDELMTPIGNGRNGASTTKITKGSIKGFRTIEPLWIYPQDYNSSDPLRPDWYRPQAWMIQGKKVHASRLLTFVGREVPDILKPSYMFGGLSMSQIAKPYIDNWLRTRQNVSDSIQKFSIMCLKTNLAEALQAQGAGDQLFKRLVLFNNTRNNAGTFAIDKEMEDFFNVSQPLGTLDHLQAQAQEQMASIASIPLVKLLGITPSGLNACLPGDTLVLTDRGQVPICEVTLSDQVMTRQGFAPLTFAGITKHATELFEIKTDNATLRCTANHPIWLASTSEFVPAENVRLGDRLLLIGGKSDSQKTLHRSRGAVSGGGRGETGTTPLGAAARDVLSFYTARFGKRITAKFHTAFTSITSTTIRPTTKSTTSSRWLRMITPPIMASTYTAERLGVVLRQSFARIAEMTLSLQSNPAGRSFALASAFSPIDEPIVHQPQCQRRPASALNAVLHSQLREKTPSFVPANVRRLAKIARITCVDIFSRIQKNSLAKGAVSAVRHLGTGLGHALDVVLNSPPLAGATRFIAPKRAKIAQNSDVTECVVSINRIATNEPVYDLTVGEGYLPEFFANGILTHNSSDGEVRCFYDHIHSYQERLFGIPLDTVLGFIQLHLFGEIDPSITYAFEPLWTLDEKEAAEVRSTEANTDIALTEAGILQPIESRQRIANDPDTPYAGLVVDDIPEPPTPEEALGGPLGGQEEPGQGEPEQRDPSRPAGAQDAEFNESDHPRGEGGKFSGVAHVVSTHDADASKTKVHGVYADKSQAIEAHRAEMQRAYKAFHEDNFPGPASSVPHRTAETRMAQRNYPAPRLESVRVRGADEQKPEAISLVHEGTTDENGNPEARMHSANVDNLGAKKTADSIARGFWDAGNQSYPGELSSQAIYDLRKTWNAEHPDHKVDRDFDFEDEGSVPAELKKKHSDAFMAEMDKPEAYPGLRKANAYHMDRDRDDGRSGVFNVTRHPVL